MSERTRAFASLAGVALLAGAAGACRGSQDLLITYFNGDYGLSVRYPVSWRTDQAEQACEHLKLTVQRVMTRRYAKPPRWSLEPAPAKGPPPRLRVDIRGPPDS